MSRFFIESHWQTALGKAPLDALFDLVLTDKAQAGALYFIANENDLRYGLKQPGPASASMPANSRWINYSNPTRIRVPSDPCRAFSDNTFAMNTCSF
jgi:hypothetical protein